MKPVVQEETTGCGIASCANPYQRLWSDVRYVRRLLARWGIEVDRAEKPFKGWAALPDCALIAIKWHRDRGRQCPKTTL